MKACKAKETGGDFEIWGTGAARRQFIFSPDLGRLLIWAVRNYNQVVN